MLQPKTQGHCVKIILSERYFKYTCTVLLLGMPSQISIKVCQGCKNLKHHSDSDLQDSIFVKKKFNKKIISIWYAIAAHHILFGQFAKL